VKKGKAEIGKAENGSNHKELKGMEERAFQILSVHCEKRQSRK